MTYRVALTGGIGSGKTLASKAFEALGVRVIDADLVSHALTGPGGEAMPAIAEAFDDGVICADGALDRAAMRTRAFQDPAARKRLEAIMHPMIRERMAAECERITQPYVILAIPLLFETGQQAMADRVLVIDVPEATQIARVRARSGLDEAEIRRIMASQVSRAERLARADDVLDNSGEPALLEAQVAELHGRYCQLAGR